ncbi:MAG: alpha/beta hydrolase [Chitinophagaceae bacterium]
MTKTFLYEGNPIRYLISGKGKPVLLLHGFGEDGAVWNEQVSFLQHRFQFIVPDLPGSGGSPMIRDMSMEGMAEVVHAVIHEEGIDACPVIGHSMGGYVTLALVEKYRNHVSAFGLFHSTAYPDKEEKKATRRKGIDFIRQHGAFEFLKTTTPNLFSSIFKEQNPGTAETFIDGLKDFKPEALIAYYEAMIRRPDRTAALQKAAVPVLFIMGKYDTAIPMDDILQQCYLPGISYIHVLQRSGHMGMMEEKEITNRVLEEFLLQT